MPRVLYFLFLLGSFGGYSQQKTTASEIESLHECVSGAIRYLQNTQCTTTIEGQQYAGEWPAFMQMHTQFFLLGGTRKYRDSNCFTTVAIHNILAEMYLADSAALPDIKGMLQKAYPEILTYRTGGAFNFWKRLPPNRDLRRGAEPDPVPLVRRPTQYKLKSRYINKAANVENDADDTASGNLAVWLHHQVMGHDTVSTATASVFDAFTDRDRKNRHWYNYLFNGLPNSGAYLTWLGPEGRFKKWNIAKSIYHNLTFYLPSSICYPVPYEPYLPYGTNDVDAIVNANVLTYLAQKGELPTSQGVAGAHRFINHQIKFRKLWRAGHYYPNTYHLHYAVSRAFLAGDTALRASSEVLLAHLLKKQLPDGRFLSRRRVNHRDALQSSAYGLLAMLNFKKAGLGVPMEPIRRTVGYLQSVKKITSDGTYFWEGGVFFSGGTVVRNVLYFTSDAYTTALVVGALQKYVTASR